MKPRPFMLKLKVQLDQELHSYHSWTDDNCIVQFVQLVALRLVSEYSVHIIELFQRVSDSEALYLESNSHEMLFCVKQRKD